jgi:hypothetical protein
MRYFPRLKVFKNSSGTNVFDGHEARSYGWYTYAVKLLDGRVVVNGCKYSAATAKHILSGCHIIDAPEIYVDAPRGLNDQDAARRHIEHKIAELEAELANPRNRDRQRRIDAIARYKTQLTNLDILAADYSARAADCTECGEAADNGEGYDGLCGTCADRLDKHR